jgi:hypothetical protein
MRAIAFFRETGGSDMAEQDNRELKRRSLLKSLIWRIIGIAWTWAGAYLILLFIPPSRRSPAVVATLIVVYHHSTRMVMYYFYERVWASLSWGTGRLARHMSWRERVLWTTGTVLSLAVIFFLIVHVTPRLKSKQSVNRSAEGSLATSEEAK